MDLHLMSARALERRYGVPAAWLLDEAAAGRLPALRAGARYLFDRSEIERCLAERARRQPADSLQQGEVRDARST